MKLIGLIGQARVGKDTVAAHLYRRYGVGQTAFAYPMKRMLEAAFPEVNFYAGDREAPIDWLGKSPRQLMQTLGTEWGRNCIHRDLWTLLAEREVIKARERHYDLVLSDVRFHNEADMILRHGGELWHIVRDNGGIAAGHVSEMNHWDAYRQRRIVDNNGTLDELYQQVDQLMGAACAA